MISRRLTRIRENLLKFDKRILLHSNWCVLFKETDSCASTPCLHGGECTTQNDGNYTCSCQSDYSGTQCQRKLHMMMYSVFVTFIKTI